MVSQLKREVMPTQDSTRSLAVWQTEIGQLLAVFGLQEADQTLFAHNLSLWLRTLEQSAQNFRQRVLDDVQRDVQQQVQSQLAQVQNQLDGSQQDAELSHNQLVDDLLVELLASRQQVQTLSDRIALLEVAATGLAPTGVVLPEVLKPKAQPPSPLAAPTPKQARGRKRQAENPLCLFCLGTTNKHGRAKNGKRRYQCLKCQRTFRVTA